MYSASDKGERRWICDRQGLQAVDVHQREHGAVSDRPELVVRELPIFRVRLLSGPT